MYGYKDILSVILAEGEWVESRAGKAKRISHEFMLTDLRDGFPLITSRQFFYKGMEGELACFVKGHTNIDEFEKRGCNFWRANLDDWNAKRGTPNNKDLGKIYGYQLRNFNGVDQLRKVIDEAKTNPQSRRLLVSYWNPPEMDDMVLPSCHYSWQISVVGGHLDLIFNMRSCDMALGFPTDLASYALLAHLIANELGLTARFLTAVIADAHIYERNIPGVEHYIDRKVYPRPKMKLLCPKGMPVEDFDVGMVEFTNYAHGGPINMGGMAV